MGADSILAVILDAPSWPELITCTSLRNVVELDRSGGRGVMVWGGIMLRNRTYLQIFERGTLNSRRYCEKETLPNVYLFRAAVSPEFIFMDNNARVWDRVAEHLLLSVVITHY